MSRESDRLLEIVEALDGSTSLQVGATMPLFNRGNANELLFAMPLPFRADFLSWCSRMRKGGPPLRDWTPEFAQGFAAVCQWIDEKAAEAAEDDRATERADPRLDGGLPFEDRRVTSHEPPRKAA